MASAGEERWKRLRCWREWYSRVGRVGGGGGSGDVGTICGNQSWEAEFDVAMLIRDALHFSVFGADVDSAGWCYVSRFLFLEGWKGWKEWLGWLRVVLVGSEVEWGGQLNA